MRGSCMVCVPASCVASHVSTRRMADMGEASPPAAVSVRSQAGREPERPVVWSETHYLLSTSCRVRVRAVRPPVCSFLGEQSFECVELQRPACSLSFEFV